MQLRSSLTTTTAVATALLTIGLGTLTAMPASALPPAPSPSPTASATARPVVPVATRLDHTLGHSASSRLMTLQGTGLKAVTGVLVAGTPAVDFAVVDDHTLRFRIGTAPNFQAGTVSIALTTVAGTVRTPLSFRFGVANKRDRQMQYAFKNWNLKSSKQFGYLPGNDCANFTSQTLLARGWKESSAWYNDGSSNGAANGRPVASGTWVSSTALSNWLATRKDLATKLLYRQRDQAVVGDIVQFNWDSKANPGNVWLHTGVVSKVVVLPNGRHDVYYVAHTNNSQFGGSTEYFAHTMTKNLRIQFWHLKK